MIGSPKSPRLISEETRTIKFFLVLFYIFFFAYDIFNFYILPIYTKRGVSGLSDKGFGFWYHIAILGLLSVSLYFIKKGNPYIVKYIFLYSYTAIETINSLFIYLGSDKPFASGNIVELLFVFFSPIFVNKKYFWTAAICMIGKYVIIGVILQESNVLLPIITLFILSVIAYFLLTRFTSYIHSLTTVHLELRQKEKLAVIGQMAAGIGHEIRNPLSSLKGFTQLQRERYPNTNEFYPIMIQEIDRINLIVNDLMYLGRPKEVKFAKANIEEIIAYTLSITHQQAERAGVMIETILAGPLPPLDCDTHQLKQVFINLIKNAIESMPDGGRITIKVKVVDGKKMYITIEDEGCGIDEESIPNLGEPFYTTKTEGTGLGLMVTNQIINDHHGEITITSKREIGTIICVTLPITQQLRKE
ncbi:ATP-binding protein [Neobacillus niacini]|uniref:ATP-binding protein n=1 Tax=Neobacillus niacini TaxID=86668 RepID=UPI0020414C6E|nr:ATP-binding protein [Neobacillus niacini]MCM3694391.1 ATP-binding protein [Neobacillus niacini]